MKRKVLVAAMLSGLLAAAACSSSGSATNSGTSGANSAPAGSQSNAAGRTGQPIVIGTVGGYTGSQSASSGLVDDGSQVWAKWVNDNGGINGHPVKLIVKDDAGDPAKALQAVKELIQTDHVLAIVGEHSLVDATWADYAKKQGVPVVGGVPIETPMYTNSDFFPSGANVVAMIVGELIAAKADGLKKFGLMYCAESPVCAGLGGLIQAGAGIVGGIGVGPSVKIAATQPSYTAECLTMKNAGVDALMIGENAPTIPRVMQECARLGYKPTQVNQGTTSSNAWLKEPTLQGAILTSPNAVYNDASVPGVKTFLDALQKYEPSVLTSDQFDANVSWAWAGGMLFKKAAEAANVDPSSTPADVLKGLYSLKKETLDGFSPPLTFTKGQPTFISCYFTMTIKDSKYAPTNGGKTTCLTQAQVTSLFKVLGG